nr:retrovirus-related Pol polyprotein from transposon TNT 1-94 [Tanacetum cinerariifolium]
MLLMQAQENGVALDAKQLLFLAGGQDNAFDDDVDEQPVQDLALNVDNVFQANDCDAFDSDVDEAPTAQTMFMANLSSADPVTDEAGPSYDSNILSKVQDHDHYQDTVCTHHDEHAMHDSVQLDHVVDSHAEYTSDSNMIPYDQNVKDSEVTCSSDDVQPKQVDLKYAHVLTKLHWQDIHVVPDRHEVDQLSLYVVVNLVMAIIVIHYAQPEDSKELFQKLLEDLQIINKELKCNRPTFSDNNEDHSAQHKEYSENSSNEIAVSSSNQEKEGPPQDSDIRQLIREECCIEVCEEQKQNMENTILELVEIYHQKELLCMHDNVDDLIESALNSKLLSINSQRLDKKKQEVKNVVEQPAERGNRIIKSLQNFRVIHKSSISLKNTSQIYPVHAVTPILSTKEPKYSPSMGYEHPNTTPETESDEIIKSGVEELLPILSENEVTSEDKRECDMPVYENSPICDDHSEIFSDSNNDDDISIDDDDFEDIEYVEATLPNPEIFSIEEENVVCQGEEEVDLEDIFQIQDVILREKLLSINRLIANIESLNDNPTLDRMLNSSVSFPISEESDNSLSDNFLPEFKTFCDHTEETRSSSTITHADDSLPGYDSFCFEIEPDQERLINVVKNDISDASDIRFLEALLIDDSIPFPNNESSEYDFDNPSFSRPPPEPPDADFEPASEEEIPVVMNDRDELDVSNDEDVNFFPFMFVIQIFLPYLICSMMFLSFLSAESEDTIFDPGISV